jgi:hypothetical protein
MDCDVRPTTLDVRMGKTENEQQQQKKTQVQCCKDENFSNHKLKQL